MSDNFYTNIDRRGNNILFRGIQDGKPLKTKVPYSPHYYEARQGGEYKAFIDGFDLERVDVQTISEFYEKTSNRNDLYGNKNHIQSFIQENYPTRVDFDMKKINTTFFDIEYDASEGLCSAVEATKPINAVTFKPINKNVLTCFSLYDYDPKQSKFNRGDCVIKHTKCRDEEHLLKCIIGYWSSDYPDVISGWNIVAFDIVYLMRRIERVLGESWAKKLSPWGSYRVRDGLDRYNNKTLIYSISGVSIIDQMDAFAKFGYEYGRLESNSLNYIASLVLGEEKLGYDGSLFTLHLRDPQLYVDYNIKDTYLLQRLEEESGLLSIAYSAAYRAGVNYEDVFGTTAVWENILYRTLSERKIIPSMNREPAHKSEFIGGFVKEPKPKFHRWVASFDLNSLYPHLMKQYNISPETYITHHRENASIERVLNGLFINTSPYVVAANGACFDKEVRGIIPEIIESYYAERDVAKNEKKRVEKLIETHGATPELLKEKGHYNNIQMTIKILMNSLYGAFGNIHFKYYVADIAEAITTSGRLSLFWAEKTVNNFLNRFLKTENVDYILYMDTDSIYVSLETFMKTFFKGEPPSIKEGERVMDEFCKVIAKEIAEGYERLAKVVSAPKNEMVMKREKLSHKALFLKKKKYALSVLNNEGVSYAHPKMSITGLEIVKSSVPKPCRDVLRDVIDAIFEEDEKKARGIIEDFRKRFNTLQPDEISMGVAISDYAKYYDHSTGGSKKGCPIHVRGAINYNRYVDRYVSKHGVVDTYNRIENDKVKFVYLIQENPTGQNVISFKEFLPPEFDLHKYIDYNEQFDKVFLEAATRYFTAANYKIEEKGNLDDLFGF